MQQTFLATGSAGPRARKHKDRQPQALVVLLIAKASEILVFQRENHALGGFTSEHAWPCAVDTKSILTVQLVSFVLNNQFLLYKTVEVHSK
jgi:hypothetical protein